MHALILAVGNDEFTARVLPQLTELKDCVLQEARGSREALQLIQAQQPDIVIVQDRLEDGPGLGLCRYIKDHPKLAWIYCVLLLAEAAGDLCAAAPSGDLDRAAEMLEGGADAVQGLNLSARLLQARVRVGLRLVENQRSLMRTNDLLTSIALADPLTQLKNRRALDRELPRQIQQAHNRSQPLGLIMLDVDFFKSINDRYGHLAGDRALQLVANRLQYNLRLNNDHLFRYGGEDFVIILTNTEIEEAVAVGRRLCGLIADQPFGINDQIILQITVSIGVSCLRSEDDLQGTSLIDRADQALLKAKANGRNQVMNGEAVAVAVAASVEASSA